MNAPGVQSGMEDKSQILPDVAHVFPGHRGRRTRRGKGERSRPMPRDQPGAQHCGSLDAAVRLRHPGERSGEFGAGAG